MPETPDRTELIKLCKKGVVPVDLWRDRDSSAAQMQLGEARALLAAGCEFEVAAQTKHNSWWVTITYPGFGYFDWGDSPDEVTFYVPTADCLKASHGRDWY